MAAELSPTVPAALPERLRMTEPELRRFLSQPRVAVLSWVARNGELAATPIWFRYRDGVFLLHTAHPSPKTKAILRNDRVALLIHDDTPPYRYVSVRGRARIRFEEEQARRLYEEQARMYYGPLTGAAYLRQGRRLANDSGSSAKEVIIEITPTKTTAMNGPAAISVAQRFGLRAARTLKL
jgi:PPOX class probable F420-dependent enzyme